jgi:glycosyltransferase involved in cell wall biosynthesis
VVCAERDRSFFTDPTRVLVVPNGVSAELLAAPALPRDPDTLVMVGTMRYAPNVDGALWFTREILPRVAAVAPAVRLFLVGDDRLGLLKSAHDGVRVFVTGRVEDVASYVSRATLSVVPLRVAGGTRIKILESMALGTPVVSTTIGAEGLDVVPGRHLGVADTPDRIAAAIVDLLRDEPRRRALAEAGRRLVAERYTWDTVGRSLRDMISEWLTEQRAPRGRARVAAR